MLCLTCETFVSNILNQDFFTWRRPRPENPNWLTFKIGNHTSIAAAAEAGCEVCALLSRVRNETIPNYEGLNEKWLVQPASIDYDLGNSDRSRSHLKWTFHLLTVAPEMSWIAFEIFNPNTGINVDSANTEDYSSLPSAVSDSPTVSKTLQIVKGWIDQCIEDHSQCSRSERIPLPTRVVDVGYSDGPPTPRLQINRGQHGRYVTLSHCWGTGQRLTLTKRNLNAFQKSIPFNQLPKTFQDAIEITRLLGLRYIWIDALNIVQDDPQDWRRESTSMCAVFENALFSISALAATDCHSGFLQERRTPQVEVEINDGQVGIRKRLDSLPAALQGSRLESRAWCWQERLLPQAILHVGTDQMFWECHSGTSSETVPAISSSEQSRDVAYAFKVGSEKFENISQNWLSLASRYSTRQLTRISDRLPAIAGLADKARKELGDVAYLQGLWSNNLHAGLLWKRQHITHGSIIPSRDRYPIHVSTISGERPKTQIAPSWSWATTNGAIDYSFIDEYNVRSPLQADVTFNSYDDSRENNIPGAMGSLQLEGFVKRGSCKARRQSISYSESDTGDASFRPSGSLLSDEGLSCYLDYVAEPVSKSCYCLRIGNWKQLKKKGNRKSKAGTAERTAYLLLERVQDQSSGAQEDSDMFGTFRRIGMGFDDAEKVDRIFTNAERRELQLI